MKPIRDMKQRQAGFTLLEMLVALVVFGLVMAGIAQAFHYGLAAITASSRVTRTPEDLTAMDMALRRMIDEAEPDSMKGSAFTLAFTTRLPQGAGPTGGLQDVALQLGPGGVLVLHYRPHPPGLPLGPLPPARTDPLAAGVTGVRFSYLLARPDAAPVWSSKWSGKGLPLLVRMHLALNGRDWPDLVAAPAIQGN